MSLFFFISTLFYFICLVLLCMLSLFCYALFSFFFFPCLCFFDLLRLSSYYMFCVTLFLSSSACVCMYHIMCQLCCVSPSFTLRLYVFNVVSLCFVCPFMFLPVYLSCCLGLCLPLYVF